MVPSLLLPHPPPALSLPCRFLCDKITLPLLSTPLPWLLSLNGFWFAESKDSVMFSNGVCSLLTLQWSSKIAKSSMIFAIGWKELMALDWPALLVWGTNKVTGFWCWPRSTAILLACVAVYLSFCEAIEDNSSVSLRLGWDGDMHSSLLCK